MPKTEIQKRKDYYNRLVLEEMARGKKDEAYTGYLASLSEIVAMTDGIYAKGGSITADKHSELLEKYKKLIEQGDSYIKNKDNQNRRKLIAEIGKYIKKDAETIGAMDLSRTNNLKNAVSDGRRIVVKYPEGAQENVLGNSLSMRYAIKTAKGQQGFFTQMETTDLSERWEKVINKYINFFSAENQNRFKAFIKNPEAQRKLAAVSDYGDEYSVEKILVGMDLDYEYKNEMYVMMDRKADYALLEKIRDETRSIIKAHSFHMQLASEEQSRIDSKNVAMYRVAKAVGLENLIARAEPMVIIKDGKKVKGTFMEMVEGSDLERIKENDPLLKAKKISFTQSAEFHKQYSNLCVIDYLCGNNDRHRGNIIYTFDEGNPPKCTGVKGIDNDTSFPADDYDKHAENPNLYWMPTFKKMGAIDRSTADMVMKLDRELLKIALADTKLTDKEFDGVCTRLDRMKRAIEVGELEVKGEWENKFSNKMEEAIVDDIDDVLLENNYRKNSREYAKKIEFTEGSETSAEDNFRLSLDTIKSMERKMREMDRRGDGSKEFNGMRDKLYALAEIAKRYDGRDITPLDKESEDYRNFKEAVTEFSEASKEYVALKRIQPLTGRGRKRIDFAKKLQDRIWEIADNCSIEVEEKAPEAENSEEMEM